MKLILSSSNGICRRAYADNVEDAKVELQQQVNLFGCQGNLLDENYKVLYATNPEREVRHVTD